MTRWRYLLGLCALALAGVTGYVLGRSSAPTVTVEVERKEKAAAATKVDAVTAASASATTAAVDKGQSVTRRHTRRAVEPKAGGCVEEIVEIVIDRRNQSSTGASHSTGISAVKSEAKLATESEAFERLKVTERARERWSVGARAGYSLDGPPLRWGVDASVRVLGGLHVGAWVEPAALAGGALLRVTW